MLPASVVLILGDPALIPKRIYDLLPLLVTAMIYKNIADFGLSRPKAVWLIQEDGVYSLRGATAVGCPRDGNEDKTQTLVTTHASKVNHGGCDSFLFQVNSAALGPRILG